MERVLLIGGNGFIGTNLTIALRRRGFLVRVLDQYAQRFGQPLDSVEYITGNYGDPEVIYYALKGCGYVIHLAHVGTPASSQTNADEEVLNSISVFVRLLENLKKTDIRRFVFFSSGGAVYGNPDRLPVSEEYKGWPVSSYGVAKLSMEHYLHMFSRLNQIQYQIIRPANPYGPGQNFLSNQGVIPIFMYRMLIGEKITVWGDGSATKDYIFVGDLVESIVRLLTSNVVNTAFNVGSGKGVSLSDLILRIQKITQLTAKVEYRNSCKQDVQNLFLDCTKLRDALNWSPEVDLDSGIAETFNWLKQVIKG